MVETRPKLETDNSGSKTAEHSDEHLNMVDLFKPTERTNGIPITSASGDRDSDRDSNLGGNRDDRNIGRAVGHDVNPNDRNIGRAVGHDVNPDDRDIDRVDEDPHTNSVRALSNESQDLMRVRRGPSMPTPSDRSDLGTVDIPPLPKYDTAQKPLHSKPDTAEQPAHSDLGVAEKPAHSELDAAEKPHSKPGSVDRTKPLEYLPNLKPYDDTKRTVLLLDDFRNVEMYLRGDEGFSHGELSSRLAEENGFNAIRTQVGFNKPGYFDIGNSLKSINEDIDSGKLKLGHGDIINVSLALNKKFDEVSKVLGMEITPENLKELRPDILKAMREKAGDKSVPKETRGWLKQCADINDEIQQLQDRGIIVTTAEGNKGSDNFNISLLAADRHYSSLNADGTVADYATHNSLTTEARAEINFYARPLDVFDPRPFAQQTGTYKLEGSSIKIPADEFGGFLDAAAPNSGLAHSIMFSPAEVTVTKDGTTVIKNSLEVPLQPLESPETRLTGYLAFSERGSSFANAFGIPAEFSTESQRDKQRE